MNATLTFNAITSSDRLPFYQSNNCTKVKHFYSPRISTHPAEVTSSQLNGDVESKEEVEEPTKTKIAKDLYTTKSAPIRVPGILFNEDSLPLATSSKSFPPSMLHKSNSYSGVMRPKATILKHNSVNGSIATSLTDDELGISVYRNTLYVAPSSQTDLTANTLHNYDDDAVIDLPDENDLLMPSAATACGGVGGGSSIASISRRNSRGTIKARNTLCNRLNISRKCFLGILLLLIAIAVFLVFAYLTRAYTKNLLLWIEKQNPWIIVAILISLFVLVSFPIVVGYFVLMLTSGYIFGVLKGVLIVIVGANIGVAVAYWTIRSFRHRIPIHKLIKNETGRAILRVISGPKAFKVVLFTRLTPIPFGLQNTIFAVSAINPRVYHTASLIGLMPAQMINAYLGSTLRSMQEVLSNHGTAVTGYISFGLEVICGVALMVWVIQKARKELAQTLLADLSNEGKLIEIDV